MTSLLERLQHDLNAAMKVKNDIEKSALRMAIAAVKNAAVAGDEAVTLSDDQVVAVLQAEAKKRAEAADIYKDAGRTEAEANERAELAILEKYLPARMSDDELHRVIAAEVAAAAAAGATGPKAMGQVVKAVRAKVGSSA
ncbi:MAG: GatB/YqeY domain-containing protein, partial [Actinobacteria bacterium]|nr:GatB/YqeY domain-containing protein [Actinomycetota bacterium]